MRCSKPTSAVLDKIAQELKMWISSLFCFAAFVHILRQFQSNTNIFKRNLNRYITNNRRQLCIGKGKCKYKKQIQTNRESYVLAPTTWLWVGRTLAVQREFKVFTIKNLWNNSKEELYEYRYYNINRIASYIDLYLNFNIFNLLQFHLSLLN